MRVNWSVNHMGTPIHLRIVWWIGKDLNRSDRDSNEVLLRHFPGGTEQSHDKSQRAQSVSWPRWALRLTSPPQLRAVTGDSYLGHSVTWQCNCTAAWRFANRRKDSRHRQASRSFLRAHQISSNSKLVPKFGRPELQVQKAFFFELLNNYTLWGALEISCLTSPPSAFGVLVLQCVEPLPCDDRDMGEYTRDISR